LLHRPPLPWAGASKFERKKGQKKKPAVFEEELPCYRKEEEEEEVLHRAQATTSQRTAG
jgi:hypothetical protein